MKHRLSTGILTVCIALLALAACCIGIFSFWGGSVQRFTSIHGVAVTLYGHGIYANDSVSAAAQGIAQDWVTMVLGIPLLLLSALHAIRGSLRARLLLAGTLAYFLYTYMSYAFLWMYNPLFLVYAALMSMSFFALVLVMMSFDIPALAQAYGGKIPVRTIGGFIIAFAAMIAMMWLGRILPPLAAGTTPPMLEHYTTLVIQAMDLGFVIPVSILSAVLLIQKKPFGLLLASVMCMKGTTMLTSLTAMVINQLLAGVKLSPAEIIIFPAANILVLIGVFVFMKNIREPGANSGQQTAAH